jgi:hypothetical protein
MRYLRHDFTPWLHEASDAFRLPAGCASYFAIITLAPASPRCPAIQS